ncbi:hypothetical protein AMATHDRAFT_50354 [Amanita thiersii Skay4041]|uniref:BTB domain-containing protein n=1 Tax=Amanita thiersii Skay4041 TaxID=703135 RepID=A0A2A9N9T5_9AGAR|nr:hypothetical protein AMATHDRAFT_50354 [Amanita thiersii Skay4041]
MDVLMSSLSAIPAPTPVYIKHETFYFADVYFVFEETLFKIPQLYIQESPVIKAALKTEPSAAGDEQNERTNIKGNGTFQNPFICSDIEKGAFVALLNVLYPMRFNKNSYPPLLTMDWIKVLDLSFRWKLDEVHSIAIHHLTRKKLDAIEKLELANKYGIESWIIPAIKELVEKGERITAQGAMRIGVELALRIAHSQGEAKGRSNPEADLVSQPAPIDPIERKFEDLVPNTRKARKGSPVSVVVRQGPAIDFLEKDVQQPAPVMSKNKQPSWLKKC